MTLPVGPSVVSVGAGGPPGERGRAPPRSTASAPLPAARPTPSTLSPVSASGISGTEVTYGGAGTPTSGTGIDGRGVGGGGPAPSRGGNGIVIIRYEVAG